MKMKEDNPSLFPSMKELAKHFLKRKLLMIQNYFLKAKAISLKQSISIQRKDGKVFQSYLHLIIYLKYLKKRNPKMMDIKTLWLSKLESSSIN